MKRKILAGLCAGVMICSVFAGCKSQPVQESAAQSTVQESQAEESTAAAQDDATAQSSEETQSTGESQSESQPESNAAAVTLEDGTYSANFDTDSSMFKVNETKDGKGVLTVQDGQMTIHVTLRGKKILNLYPGLAEDAGKDGAVLLEPTTDTVTYSDGLSEEVYGFDIPVPAIGKEFDVALVGEKGTWYDHKVSVSDPVKAE